MHDILAHSGIFRPHGTGCFKIDWITEGTAWIFMQPAHDEESNIAAKNLVATSECDFDLEENEARLRPV